MGYYDFDEHFWSADEVCAQQPEIVARPTRWFSLRKLFNFVGKKDSYQDQLKANEGLDRDNKNHTPKNPKIDPFNSVNSPRKSPRR